MNVKLYAAQHLITEAEALAFITREIIRIAKLLAPKHRFGYFSIEDIEQQACLFGWEGLAGYDVTRPLPNYLYRHMRNRLINFKRDNFMRCEPPCKCCDPFNPPIHPCERWHQWYKRNMSKINLCNMMGHEMVETASNHSDPLTRMVENESAGLIDSSIPAHLRQDYLKLKAGVNIGSKRMEEIRKIIEEVVAG